MSDTSAPERSQKKPVSLVEVLVIVAVINLIGFMVAPIFSTRREHSYNVCPANLNQLGTASKMYSADYDDAIQAETTAGFKGTKRYAKDPVNDGTGAWPNPSAESRLAQIWTTTIQPYVKSTDMMFCPSFSEAQFKDQADKPDCDGPGTGDFFLPTVFNGPTYSLDVGHDGKLSDYSIAPAGTSGAYGGPPGEYGCIYGNSGRVGATTCPYYNNAGNGWFYKDGCTSIKCVIYQNLKETDVVESARDVIFSDGMTTVYSSAGNADTANGRPLIANFFGCEGTGRHQGKGANYGFLDTHTKYIAVSVEDILLSDPKSPGNYYVKYMSYDK